MATAVFFHAHPDDEAIATGGTMAALAAAGHRVVLVTATRGELGEVPDGFLAAGESLAERRAAELARACEALGVHRQVFLGYQDSGMAGEDSNDHPDCFARADVDEAAARLGAILDEEGATVLTAYDEHGVYGHPDHVQVHRVAARAAEQRGEVELFLATMNRDAVRRLFEAQAQFGVEVPAEEAQRLADIGVPEEQVTTTVDVRAHVGAKEAALRAHASQIPDDSFFLAMPPEVFAVAFGTEWYIHVGAEPGARETDLL